MSNTNPVDYAAFRSTIPAFKEETEKFYNGEISVKDYKGFSGKYGSYAQRGGKRNMLRLRMSGGRATKDKLKFVVDAANEHDVDLLHFTTCQTVQFHNLEPEAVYDIMDKALDHKIVCYGGGGDYPRNVMCSPLSGTDPEEYFDVMPYALASADFLLQFIDEEKMPRKLKVGFSGSKANAPHATFRDLGFMARPDGKFDVYIAGGLGNNPKFGVLVDEGVDPKDILYYIEAMIQFFRKYGNYNNRAKARTRYMQDAFESKEAMAEAFQKELEDVKNRESITLDSVEQIESHKKGDGVELEESYRVLKQKQPGLYTVRFHPRGGSPKREVLEQISNALADVEDGELRLGPDETSYIINLNGSEAKKMLEIIDETAANSPFESSVACIGATICQVGLRDSQSALDTALNAVKEAGIAANALPQVHFSGCPSSCSAHQIGAIGFRGGIKMVDKKPVPAFVLYAGGNDEAGAEVMGKELGAIAITDIPSFLIDLGHTVEKSGMDFDAWFKANPEGVAEAAKAYTA